MLCENETAATSIYLIDKESRLQAVGQPLAVAGDQAGGVAWSPDGSMLRVGYWSGAGVLWDLTDRAVAYQLAGQSGTAARSGAAWSYDGRTLAAGQTDGTIALLGWDGLERLLANAPALACRAAGGEMSEAEWARFAPGLTQHPRACP